MSAAITEAITTLAEAEQRFNLSRTEAKDFFWNGVMTCQNSCQTPTPYSPAH